jgi:hypothetical protein
VLIAVNQIGAAFGVLTVLETVTDCPHASADAVTRFDHGDLESKALERACGRKTSEPRAGDDHVRHEKQCTRAMGSMRPCGEDARARMAPFEELPRSP